MAAGPGASQTMAGTMLVKLLLTLDQEGPRVARAFGRGLGLGLLGLTSQSEIVKLARLDSDSLSLGPWCHMPVFLVCVSPLPKPLSGVGAFSSWAFDLWVLA